MADKHKTRVRKNADSYQDWLEKKEGYDSASPEHLADASSPFSIGPVPPELDDMYAVFERMYYDGLLKGRQKEIVQLLLAGYTSQVVIAKQLNMKQSNVATELRKIGKKIIKKVSYNSVVQRPL